MMNKDPLERELQFRKSIEEAARARRESRPGRRLLGWLRSLAGLAGGRVGVVLLLVLPILLGFGGLFLVIFGVGIKWTDAYACSVAVAEKSPTVIAELGEPVDPGFFAWSFAYLHEASTTDASFSTGLAGPKGAGTLRVHFFRSPLGSSLTMDLEKDGQTHAVYRGTAPPCP